MIETNSGVESDDDGEWDHFGEEMFDSDLGHEIDDEEKKDDTSSNV